MRPACDGAEPGRRCDPGAVHGVVAEGPALDLNGADTLRHVLEMQAGRRVKLKLVSGQEFDGKVGMTGAHMVVLTELTGMELFNATVPVDQVAAVIVRARSR